MNTRHGWLSKHAIALGLWAATLVPAAYGQQPAKAAERFDKPEPLWELGVAGFVSGFPDYRGSDEQSMFAIPAPYGVYRGKRFSLARGGANADMLRTTRLDLSLSLATSLPGDADDNSARRGMPELDLALEMGPSLDILLSQPDSRWGHKIRLPFRGVIATDFSSVERIGWLAHPFWESTTAIGQQRRELEFSATAGPVFASSQYHAYYYEVAPQFVTAGRPAYEASGGYSGARFSTVLSLQRGPYRFASFAVYDDLRGAVFEDSPLVRSKSSLILGLAISWRLLESKRPGYRESSPALDPDPELREPR